MKGLVRGKPSAPSKRVRAGGDLPGGLNRHPEIIPAHRGECSGRWGGPAAVGCRERVSANRHFSLSYFRLSRMARYASTQDSKGASQAAQLCGSEKANPSCSIPPPAKITVPINSRFRRAAECGAFVSISCLGANAYSGGCRTLIPIFVGQRSDFCRTPFRFISDSVPG
jgi:hypothetical protein